MDTSKNEEVNNQTSKKKSGIIQCVIGIIRWIIGVFFAMFALVNGFHYSSLFLLCAAFLMFPFPFMENILQKLSIKSFIAIILSVSLFCVGVANAPFSEDPNPNLNDTAQSVTEESKESTFVKPDSSSSSSTNNSDSSSSSSTNNSDSSSSSNTNNSDSSTSNNTSKPESSSNSEKIEMVWIVLSGSKYHSKSTCSNMKSPIQISLEEAKERGYTACKRCH